jgi:predicted O-methyltransferase YrrM
MKSLLKKIIPQKMRRGLLGVPGKLNFWWNRPNIYRHATPERLGIIFNAQTHLTIADRLVLYTLVRGTRPRHVLEIGSAHGGSASILASAMEDNGIGQIIGLDPVSKIDVKAPHYYGRFTLLSGAAPEGISVARGAAGGNFDLVFYDGPNVYSEVSRSIEALIPHLAERAMIIFDNGLHYGVRHAVNEAIDKDSRLHDCGYLSINADMRPDPDVAYMGLLLTRFEAGNVSDPQPWIDQACKAANRTPPHLDPAIFNHDVWWCKHVRPCEKCVAKPLGR